MTIVNSSARTKARTPARTYRAPTTHPSFRDAFIPPAPVEEFMPARQLHSTATGPIGLWQLDGDLTDSSGNSRDLGESGTSGWDPGWTGLGWWVYAGGNPRRTDSTFALTGAFSCMAIVRPHTVDSTARYIASYAGSGETAATNALWAVYLQNNTLGYMHEHGSGTNVDVPFDAGYQFRLHEWVHLAVTRNAAATEVNLFMNGVNVKQSTGLTPPDGGGSAQLGVGVWGGSGGSPVLGTLNSVAVFDQELSAEQVRASYEYTHGLRASEV